MVRRELYWNAGSTEEVSAICQPRTTVSPYLACNADCCSMYILCTGVTQKSGGGYHTINIQSRFMFIPVTTGLRRGGLTLALAPPTPVTTEDVRRQIEAINATQQYCQGVPSKINRVGVKRKKTLRSDSMNLNKFGHPAHDDEQQQEAAAVRATTAVYVATTYLVQSSSSGSSTLYAYKTYFSIAQTTPQSSWYIVLHW